MGLLDNKDVVVGKKIEKSRLDQKLLDALAYLLADSGAIHVMAIQDSDCPSFTVTHLPGAKVPLADDADNADDVAPYTAVPKPRNFTRGTLILALLAAAGMEPVKKCGKCKKEKPVSSFSEHAGRTSGYASSCFACYARSGRSANAALRKLPPNASPERKAAAARDRVEILRGRAERKVPLDREDD